MASPVNPRAGWSWRGAWIILVVVALGLTSNERAMWCCTECGSFLDTDRWGIAIGGSEPCDEAGFPFRDRRIVRESRVRRRFFAGTHEHSWALSHTRNAGVPGLWSPSSCLGHYPNRYCYEFERDGGVREAVDARIASGEVTEDEIRAMLRLDRVAAGATPAEASLRARAEVVFRPEAR
jgi:hypothetical protein